MVLFEAFPNQSVTIEDAVTEGDMVAVQTTSKAPTKECPSASLRREGVSPSQQWQSIDQWEV
jgi:hypothetical protein